MDPHVIVELLLESRKGTGSSVDDDVHRLLLFLSKLKLLDVFEKPEETFTYY